MRSPIDPETKLPYPDLVPSMKDGKTILPKYSGYGDLEFITQPFVESKQGLQDLLQVVRDIRTAATTLENGGIAHDIPLKVLLDKNVTWGEHVAKHFKQDDDIVVYIPKGALMEAAKVGPYVQKFVFASVQMTAGVKLERMPYLFYQLATPGSMESKILLERYNGDPSGNAPFADALQGAVQALKGSFAVIRLTKNSPAYNKYLGAVTFLAHVLKRGAETSDLDQAKYLSPLLSRTNLGRLATVYKSDKDGFKEDVLKASSRSGADLLFPYSPLLKKITINDWLDALIAGNDPISWGQIRLGTDPHRWDPQEVGTPGNTDVGHVFEFRALGNAVHINWDATVERDSMLIADLNNSTAQVPH
jgi:hypothetical protein